MKQPAGAKRTIVHKRHAIERCGEYGHPLLSHVRLLHSNSRRLAHLRTIPSPIHLHHPRCKHIRLPLEPSAQISKQNDRGGGDNSHPGHAQRIAGGEPLGQSRIEPMLHHGSGPEAAENQDRKEHHEPSHVIVDDMAQLVGEHRLDLLIAHRLQQSIGKQNVAPAGQEPNHGRVGHRKIRLPEHDVAIAQATAPTDRLQALPQRRIFQRPGIEQPHQQKRREQIDDQRCREHHQLAPARSECAKAYQIAQKGDQQNRQHDRQKLLPQRSDHHPQQRRRLVHRHAVHQLIEHILLAHGALARIFGPPQRYPRQHRRRDSHHHGWQLEPSAEFREHELRPGAAANHIQRHPRRDQPADQLESSIEMPKEPPKVGGRRSPRQKPRPNRHCRHNGQITCEMK